MSSLPLVTDESAQLAVDLYGLLRSSEHLDKPQVVLDAIFVLLGSYVDVCMDLKPEKAEMFLDYASKLYDEFMDIAEDKLNDEGV